MCGVDPPAIYGLGVPPPHRTEQAEADRHLERAGVVHEVLARRELDPVGERLGPEEAGDTGTEHHRRPDQQRRRHDTVVLHAASP